MIDQIQMLSNELNQVMEDLQVFEKRHELEDELEKLLWEMKQQDEESENKISVRQHGGEDLGTISVEEFSNLVKKEINKTLKQF